MGKSDALLRSLVEEDELSLQVLSQPLFKSAGFPITVQVVFSSELHGKYFHEGLKEDTSSAFTPTICSDFAHSYASLWFIPVRRL